MEVGRFAAWAALREAWRRLPGSRRVWVYMSLTVVIVGWLVTAAVQGVLPPRPVETVTLESGEVVRLVRARPGLSLTLGGPGLVVASGSDQPWPLRAASLAVTSLFAGAFAAYGLRRAVGLEVRYAMLADHLRRAPTFLVYGLATTAAALLLAPVAHGALLAAAWLVCTVAFGFAPLFVVDRDAGPLDALRASAGVVARNLPQTLLLLGAGVLASLLTSLPMLPALAVGTPAVRLVAASLSALASLLVNALFAVAAACAFRDAVGVRTAGGPEPLEGARDARTLSSGA